MASGQEIQYDYIVVGAGSAGAVIASRLTENGRYRVLLLEAGRKSHFWSTIPIGFALLIDNPAANWMYQSEPEQATNGRRIPVPRGKLLGGSSAINGMVFTRGQAEDFNTWAQFGNRGWSYEDVLPFFKRIEHFEGGDPAYRGNGGPVNVKLNEASGPLVDTLFAAAGELGIARNPDYNGASQDGMCITQASIGNGRRQSTARCYLEPARKRANLTIITDALAHQLIFDGARCSGVKYAVNGKVHETRAGREVVVSAGAINSPQLLELSGIGQPERLREMGIEVRHALPGVGENLRDHFAPRLKWSVTKRGITWNDTMRGTGMVREALRYALTRKGFFAMSVGPTRAFVRSREGLIAPDIGVFFSPFLMTPQFRLAKQQGLTVITHQLRPESMGSIHIRSHDPDQPPMINFNFLDTEIDRQVTLAAVRISRNFFDTEALRSLRVAELMPGEDVRSDDEVLDWVRRTAETAYHPVGTCKMGSDPNAVVDERLRVHGVPGLRVADASIMPTLTSGNTNAPSMMIGEKAAVMILEEAQT